MRKIYNVAVALMLFQVAWGQGVTTGSLSGRAREKDGSSLIGATITLVHVNSGSQYHVITNEDGLFDLSGLRVGGPYTLKATYIGFTDYQQTDLYVELGQKTQVNVVMGEATNSLNEVVVTAANANLMSRTALSEVVGVRQLTQLPTLNRSMADFTRLMPESSPVGFMGQSNKNNFVTVDGASFNNSFGLGGDNLLPGNNLNVQPISLDAIEQIQVSTSPWDVRQGGFTGAGINSVTRSGDNIFRGSVYTYFQNNALVGKKLDGDKLPINDFNQTISGLRLGGPLIKNKLFFFVSYERTQVRTPAVTMTPGNTGLTGASVSNIQESTLQEIQSFVRDVHGYDVGRYQGYNLETKGDNFLIKLNWNINSKHDMSLRYSQMEALNDAGSGGLAKNSVGFENLGWTRNASIKAFVGELNSRLSSAITNRLFVSYTGFPEYRVPRNNKVAPYTVINDNGLAYQLGTNAAAWGNRIVQNTLQIQEDLTLRLKKHSLTAGISYQHFNFSNSFTLYNNGYYVFNSLPDFYNNSATGTNTPVGPSTGLGRPVRLTINYPLDDSRIATYVNPKFAQTGIYLYDEFEVNSYFKLNGGIRADLTSLLNKPANNPGLDNLTFQNENGQHISLSTTAVPSKSILISPRVGFSWDILKNGILNLRGGSGVFTGKVPFVFIEKAYSLSGQVEGTVATEGRFEDYPWRPSVLSYIPNERETTSTYTLATIDKNYTMPQIWRSSIGADYKIAKSLVLSADFTHSRDLNASFYTNTNLDKTTLATGMNGRQFFGDSRINNNIIGAYQLVNRRMGSASYATVKLNKSFANKWFAMAGYSYGTAKNVNDLNQTLPDLAYSRTPVVGNGDIAVLSPSIYNVRHNLTAGGSYQLSSNIGTTTFSLFLQGSGLGRYSYVANVDLNKDGSTQNDLIFVPKTHDQITFDESTLSREVQWQTLDRFIEQDPYLRTRRGQFAERNGAQLPFYFKADAKVVHEVGLKGKTQSHAFQVSVDIFNLTNLLNPHWGVLKTAATSTPISYNAQGLAKVNPDVLKTSFVTNSGIASRWQMQIGIRYLLNN